jgi:hypothetical protein
MSTLDALKEEALAALIEGNGEEALRCLGALEALDPASGSWPHKRGQLLLRLGRKDEAVEALGRAAERYGRCGLAAKAIAVSKTILAADPGHTRTQDRLSELLATSEGPDRGAATAWSIPRGNPGPAGAPLLERTLADLVPGPRSRWRSTSRSRSPIRLPASTTIRLRRSTAYRSRRAPPCRPCPRRRFFPRWGGNSCGY